MQSDDDLTVPVITIDGPSGTGKGTISQWLAQRLGWHWLDSGAWYRILAWYYLQGKYASQAAFLAAVDNGDIDFKAIHFKLNPAGASLIFCDKLDITADIRGEACAQQASKLGAQPPMRQLLLSIQHNYRRMPGLVADGRDMGTVIFPDATLKLYLTASAEARAKRRYTQLIQRGQTPKLDHIVQMLRERDQRDATRQVAACKPAVEAVTLDTSELNIQQVQAVVWRQVKSSNLIG